MTNYPYTVYESSIKENMYDTRKAHNAVIKFHEEYAPDGACYGNSSIFSGQAQDAFEYNDINIWRKVKI